MVGGKLLVGQAGGATAVINRSLVGIISEAQSSEHVDAVWGMRRGVEGALQGELVELSGLSRRALSALGSTPGAALGSSRHKVSDDEIDALLALLESHDIRWLLYIGGNDSADTLHRLALRASDWRQGVCAIAVPKTIDNDLPVTDHSPGYGSIARYIANATMDSAKDTESMPSMYPIKVIEVMGRNAGWVAAAATLGKARDEDAPHLIYVPECWLSVDELVRDVERVYRAVGYVVAVAAETIRDERGEPFADPIVSAERDAFGHPLLRGTADAMCRIIQNELGLRSRFDKPGSLQRMAMSWASSVDLEEAEEVGRAAVRLAMAGDSDRMVTIVRENSDPYRWRTDSAPLEEIANRQWLLPTDFLTPDSRGTTEAFRKYALPLLGRDPFSHYTRLEDFLDDS